MKIKTASFDRQIDNNPEMERGTTGDGNKCSIERYILTVMQ